MEEVLKLRPPLAGLVRLRDKRDGRAHRASLHHQRGHGALQAGAIVIRGEVHVARPLRDEHRAVDVALAQPLDRAPVRDERAVGRPAQADAHALPADGGRGERSVHRAHRRARTQRRRRLGRRPPARLERRLGLECRVEVLERHWHDRRQMRLGAKDEHRDAELRASGAHRVEALLVVGTAAPHVHLHPVCAQLRRKGLERLNDAAKG
mmetsp:Transcript_984/g.3111  ORF Transcript_984/g.3111 Transcript_984/m.3111 type:complete len:208 (+) Transcript_984:1173-1796(+)